MRILRAGLWERVSTEEQAKFGFSIQAQKEALEEYCDKNRIKIVDHYCDEGVSAGKPYTKRPEMMRLLQDVMDGKIDIILFTRLDRWFRNVKEYFKVQEILDDNKIEWRAIWEDYDTTTPNGRMAITIFLAIAQNEREKISERIVSVFESKRKRKESFFGKNSTPFGYIEKADKDGAMRLVKDPDIEPAIQEFWDIAIAYENVDKAAREINLEYGLQRTKKNWHRMAKNEIYTGVYKGVEDYCPPYVSKEDWSKLQNRGKIRKTQCDRVYLFTGLIWCPICKKKMISKYCKQTRKNGEIKEYYTYKCRDKAVGICSNKHTISQLKAEQWLLNNLDKEMEKTITEIEIARSKPKPKANTNIKALKEQMRRIEVVYLNGGKTDEQYVKETNELKIAIKKAESELPIDPYDVDIEKLREILNTDYRTMYETLSQEDKRVFWRSLIKQIHVNGNSLVSVDFY